MKKILLILLCVLVGVAALYLLWSMKATTLININDTSYLVPGATSTNKTTTTNNSKYPEVTFTPIALSPTQVTGNINVGPFSKFISVPVTFTNGKYVANTTLDLSAFNFIGASNYKQAVVQVNVTLK
ncbi:MAG: hypothetical protein V4526_00230 [Patescibacteria group bacterium]